MFKENQLRPRNVNEDFYPINICEILFYIWMHFLAKYSNCHIELRRFFVYLIGMDLFIFSAP